MLHECLSLRVVVRNSVLHHPLNTMKHCSTVFSRKKKQSEARRTMTLNELHNHECVSACDHEKGICQSGSRKGLPRPYLFVKFKISKLQHRKEILHVRRFKSR